MTDPRRIAHAMNPRPFAHPANRDDPLGPSIVKEAEEERQELIRRAEGVLVELRVENARLRGALEKLSTSECFGGGEILGKQLSADPFGREIIARMGLARAALNEGGPLVLATPEVVKTMVKEARAKALDEAQSAVGHTEVPEGLPNDSLGAWVVALEEAEKTIRALKEQPNE